MIHPFTWMLKDDSKDIEFDWEHTEYAFIDPKYFGGYDTVPNLEAGFRRCLVSPETEKALKMLRDDHESGAQQMASNALQALLEIGEKDLAHITDTKEFWRELRLAAWHLAKEGRPSMGAAIETVLLKALSTIKNHLDGQRIAVLDIEDFRRYAQATIKDNIYATKHTMEFLARHFLDHGIDARNMLRERSPPFTTNIVTLSSSGTTKECLKELLIWNLSFKKHNIKLRVLESRPKFEGTAFANALLDSLESFQTETIGRPQDSSYANLKVSLFTNLKVEVVSDASVGEAVKDANFLVLGADKVMPNGDLSNKIGSLSAAVMAKTLNPACKVIAVFQADKITGFGNDGSHDKVEYNDAKEMSDAWDSGVASALAAKKKAGFQIAVKNAYFEWVPAKFIDAYISEQGMLSIDDIGRISVENGEREKKIFGDV
jgi:translation initiation factor 2B subunit (eIF-2B alpha/beta/delta family)